MGLTRWVHSLNRQAVAQGSRTVPTGTFRCLGTKPGFPSILASVAFGRVALLLGRHGMMRLPKGSTPAFRLSDLTMLRRLRRNLRTCAERPSTCMSIVLRGTEVGWWTNSWLRIRTVSDW